ncbi:MAG: formylglycine-generating enzyme family protein [Pseudomonadota bacterium]
MKLPAPFSLLHILVLVNLVPIAASSDEGSIGTFRECDACPEMVNIPAGSFLFGSPEDEAGRTDDEGPQSKVTLDGFAVSKFEITLGQYQAFVSATNYQTEDICLSLQENGSWGYQPELNWQTPGFEQSEDHPVVCVSWHDANAYVGWLNTQTPKGTYRLLTESEWEYAARAGTTTTYWWGANQDEFCKFTNGGDALAGQSYGAWDRAGECSDGHLYTAPVGAFKAPNAFGLHDMVGNVWEWVADCYQPSLSSTYFSEETVPEEGCEKRAVRGGAWDYSPLYLRSAYRGAWNPTQGFSNFGFRVAKSLGRD